MLLALIARRQPHHNNIVGVFSVLFRVYQLYNFIIDDAGIRIVDSTMATDQQLRDVVLIGRMVELPEARVGINDIGDTLCRVKASDLNEVFSCRPLQLDHLLLDTKRAELA